MLVMPDLFIDRLVKITTPIDDFISNVASCYERGGGNVFGNEQQVVLGGNAANLARALAALNVPTTLAVVTDNLGRQLARLFLHSLPVEIITYSVNNPSMTVALEFIDSGRRVSRNVMLSDAGNLRTLDVKAFLDDIGSIIRRHKIIAIVNQASNDHYVDLVIEAHRRSNSESKFFLDFADLSSRSSDFVQQLATKLFYLPKLEWIGMNENECQLLARQLLAKEISTRDEESLVSVARELASRYPKPTWLLHTAKFSLACKEGKLVAKAKAITLKKVTRSTGAGDTWNAGFLTSIINNPSDIHGALMRANIFAGYFIQENRFLQNFDNFNHYMR